MANFSTFERSLIDKLLLLDDTGSLLVMNNILEFSFDDFNHMYIDDIDDCQCTLNLEERYFAQKEEAGGVEAISEIFEGANKKFLLMSQLFTYLINNKYLIVSGHIDCNFIGIKGNTRYITYTNLDIEVANFIWKYCDKRFTPTESLKKFVRNGYKTDEELALEAQTEKIKASSLHSNIALAVSLSGLVVSIIIPLFVTAKVELVNKKFNVGITGESSIKTFSVASSVTTQKMLKAKVSKRYLLTSNQNNSCSNIVLTEAQFNNLMNTLKNSKENTVEQRELNEASTLHAPLPR